MIWTGRTNKPRGFPTQGVKVLVAIPEDLQTAARIFKATRDKNVPGLTYNRLILNCDVDIYRTCNTEKVCYKLAKGLLEKVLGGHQILMGGGGESQGRFPAGL